MTDEIHGDCGTRRRILAGWILYFYASEKRN